MLHKMKDMKGKTVAVETKLIAAIKAHDGDTYEISMADKDGKLQALYFDLSAEEAEKLMDAASKSGFSFSM